MTKVLYSKIGGHYRPPHWQGESALQENTFWNVLKWQASGSRAKWPKSVANRPFPAPPVRVRDGGLSVTWIGHSTTLVQTAGLNIITDPFFSKRASPLQFAGPARVREPGIALQNLPPLDMILLSHSHYDHMDKPSLRWLAQNHKARLITPLGNRRHAPGFDTTELDWRETVEMGPVRITATPALHWSKRTLRDTNKSLWSAFVIEAPVGVIYFAADTGYGDGAHFKEIRETYGPPLLSLLPIGAYEPRWFMAPQHMNPQEAVKAHLDLGSKQSLAIHHGTIQLTDEAIDAPLKDLDLALSSAKLDRRDFLVPDVGETIVIA